MSLLLLRCRSRFFDVTGEALFYQFDATSKCSKPTTHQKQITVEWQHVIATQRANEYRVAATEGGDSRRR